MEIVIIALALIIVVLVVLHLRHQPTQQLPDHSESILLMQRQVESLRADLRSSLQNTADSVQQQLALVTQQLQSQTSSVGNRLDNASRVIGDVQKNLGELGKATQEIKELGQSVSKLDDLLRAPKLRGGLGEFLLEDLLKQVLPAGHYEMQYRFRNGQTVDAVIRTADRLVSVDSKFPLENFRKMVDAHAEPDQRTYQKAFLSDVKKHIDSVAAKYILPDEGTFPFALMYIPAENVYYEIIIKDETADGAGLFPYATERKVIPVSPNSFYAYLQVIALGLRGLRIEQSAREILNTLTRLHGDVSKVREAFGTLGSHLDNARKKYDEADKRLTNFEDRLENVVEKALPADQPERIYVQGTLAD